MMKIKKTEETGKGPTDCVCVCACVCGCTCVGVRVGVRVHLVLVGHSSLGPIFIKVSKLSAIKIVFAYCSS